MVQIIGVTADKDEIAREHQMVRIGVNDRTYTSDQSTKKEATTVMFDYYSANRTALPKNIPTKRAIIIDLLMNDSSAVDAFDESIRELP